MITNRFFCIPALLAGALALLGCQQQQVALRGPQSVLIDHVQVVDVVHGQILTNRQIAIDSGRIVSIGDEVADPGSYATRIDGQGAYAVPGLTEMHAHIPAPPATDAHIEETLFLYLANGITTIRGMLGHPRHLELRERQQAGELLSPRIFTSSPSLNGNTVPSPAAAARLVRQYAAEGYDFLKIHPGIERPVFDTLVKTARDAGIPFAGHVPVQVGIRHALESGYATIDHVDGYLEGLVPETAGVKPEENGFFGYSFTPLADTTNIAGLVALTRDKQVWIVPTQSLFERWFAPTDADSLLAEPEMQYMAAETLRNWKNSHLQYLADPTWSKQQWVAFDALRRQLIYRLYQDGHGLLLGSDAPQVFNVPGYSIHHEIDAMRRAGIPPAEILRMGTLYPARFFGTAADTGSLEAGKEASLFLVGGNPLEDPAALQAVHGVMLKGHWMDRDALDTRLKEIARGKNP